MLPTHAGVRCLWKARCLVTHFTIPRDYVAQRAGQRSKQEPTWEKHFFGTVVMLHFVYKHKFQASCGQTFTNPTSWTQCHVGLLPHGFQCETPW